MTFLSLIGHRLKHNDVIEVLEDFDMTVEYDFDRSHENMPDKYWAISKEHGLEFCFDDDQVLQTIFIYRSAIDGYTPFSRRDCDLRFCDTIEEAELWMREKGLVSEKGTPRDFQGIWRQWIRAEDDGKIISYEFRREGPSMLTVYRAK